MLMLLRFGTLQPGNGCALWYFRRSRFAVIPTGYIRRPDVTSRLLRYTTSSL